MGAQSKACPGGGPRTTWGGRLQSRAASALCQPSTSLRKLSALRHRKAPARGQVGRGPADCVLGSGPKRYGKESDQ